MSIVMLEDIVRDGIDDGFKAVVAQLTKNLIDGTTSAQRFASSLDDAIQRRGNALTLAMKAIAK